VRRCAKKKVGGRSKIIGNRSPQTLIRERLYGLIKSGSKERQTVGGETTRATSDAKRESLRDWRYSNPGMYSGARQTGGHCSNRCKKGENKKKGGGGSSKGPFVLKNGCCAQRSDRSLSGGTDGGIISLRGNTGTGPSPSCLFFLGK